MVMAVQTFVLKIPEAAIADLKNRLSLTRFPDAAPGEPWAYGSSVEYIRDLVSFPGSDGATTVKASFGSPPNRAGSVRRGMMSLANRAVEVAGMGSVRRRERAGNADRCRAMAP